jgi:hypothetical protein
MKTRSKLKKRRIGLKETCIQNNETMEESIKKKYISKI